MQAPVIQRAELSDIPTIAKLAEKIWYEYYPAIISRRQIAFMLEKMYHVESLQKQMQEQQHQFYLIFLNEEAIGFISIHEQKKDEWFLNKFYIDQKKAAKGIGTLVYKQLLKVLNPKKISLTVNRQNFRSINFYFKNGFRIQEVADFDIGNGYFMNDFVMSVGY